MDDFLEKLKKDRDAVKAKEAAEYDAKLRQRNETAAAAKKQTGQSGYTDVMQGEIYRLAEQRRQAQVDLDTETMNDLDARMKAIRASAGKQTFGDRVSDTLSGAMNDYAGSLVNAAAAAYDAYHTDGYDSRQIAQAEKALSTGRLSDGRAVTPAMRKTLQDSIDRMNGENPLYSISDGMKNSSQAQIESAKQGLGKAGQFAVDVGVAGAQMAGDVLASAIVPGSGLAMMGVRSFGAGAQEARENGATIGQQLAYGAGSAALSVATEKIANVAAPFKKAFGDGILEKAIPGAIRKLSGSAAGKLALSMISEGGEEMAEDLLQPILQRVTYDPEALVNYKNADYWTNMLYDGLVGAALGGVGAGVEQIGNRMAGTAQNPASFDAGAQEAKAESNSMGASQSGAQGVSGANNPPAQGTGYAATELGRPSSPLGVSATQEDASSVAPSGGNASVNMDPLLELLTGGKRVEQTKLTNEQFGALAGRGDIGMDAGGKVYQVDPAQHIDQRSSDDMGNRSIKAFQYDHPEIQPYYKEAAAALLDELSVAEKGGQIIKRGDANSGEAFTRTKRGASERISALLDDYGLSYKQIDTALNAIINDKGQENIAAAKRVEFVLDEMLTNGYQSMYGFIPANQDYINAKNSIAGSQEGVKKGRTIPDELDALPNDDGLGNANAGTVNSAFDEMQAKSDSFHPVNQQSAQRIMNDQQRAPSEVPTVNPDTGKNITKTVSTILNSPLTSPEMAVEIESAVADGKFDYVPVTDREANLKAQQDLSNRGLKTVADSFITKVELGQRITKNDMASAIAAYNQAVADGNHAIAFDLMNAIAESAHDGAQVVQAMNLMNRLTPEGRLLTLRKFVDRLNRKQIGKTAGRQTNTAPTQEQVDATRTNYVEQATGFRISDELATNYLMAETDAERAAAWDAITTDIASQIPSTFREKANFWRYTSMLLNPTTHVRNFMGNAIQAGARTIKNGVGAVIERAAVKDASQRSKSFLTGKDLKDFARGQYEADKKAAMGAGKYSDASAAGISREIQEKRKMFQGSNPLSKSIQWLGDKNTEWLDRGDVLFNKAAYVDSFAQALQAKGVTAAEAASGAKADLVSAARTYAIEEAQKATYRNTTALSEYLSRKGRYNESGTIVEKGMSIAADALMPFRRTPANILTTGIDYSPVGLTKAITYDAYQVRAGNMSAADMVDHLSAGLTGSGILLLGAYLASEGMLRAKAGRDDREEDYNQDRGAQEYAIQIGDKSYTLDWAVPAAMPLFAGAAIMESVQEGGGTFSAVADSMRGIGEVVLETSMLSSLNDFISNWSYADDKFGYAISRTLSSYAGQYVPTVGGKIASAMDDTVRKSYVEKGTGQIASDADYFAQGIAKKIPGAREALQPKVDLWGNEVSNGTAGERVFQSFLSPGYLKTVQTGKVDEELRRLAEATGSSAVYPAQVGKSFSVNGETKNLTAEEYTRYAKAVGETRFKAVSALIQNAGYQKLSDEEKAKAIADAYEYANAKGKQAVSSYQPSGFAKGAMSSVLPIDSYILYAINADRDGNGSVNGTESALTLKEISGITDQQRGKAWAQKNSSTNEAKNPFIGALPKAGISVDTSIKIYEKYRSLSNAEGMKPKEKGAQLRSYVNGLGLTQAQMQAVKDTYTLFGSYPVDW